MARELIVRTWCDLHLVEGEHVEAEELPPMTLDPRVKPRVLALCEVHRKEIFDPLVEALAELGQPVDGHRPAPQTKRRSTSGSLAHGCPVESCDYVGPSRDALGKHTRGHHDASLSALEAQSEELDPLTCPECGKTFAMPKGLGAHRSKAHGVVGTSKSARARREALG